MKSKGVKVKSNEVEHCKILAMKEIKVEKDGALQDINEWDQASQWQKGSSIIVILYGWLSLVLNYSAAKEKPSSVNGKIP